MKSLFSLYTITHTKTYSENYKYKKRSIVSFLGWNSNNNNYDNNNFKKNNNNNNIVSVSYHDIMVTTTNTNTTITIIALINIFHTNWYIQGKSR